MDNGYQYLDKKYPNAIFIELYIDKWLISRFKHGLRGLKNWKSFIILVQKMKNIMKELFSS